MIKDIFLKIFFAIAAFACLPGCTDDLLDYGRIDAEGMTEVTLDVDFMPMAGSELKSRATDAVKGNTMTDIEDMCVVVFNTDGSLYEIIEVNDPSLYTETEVERSNGDAAGGHLAGELITKRRKLNIRLEAGKSFYIYAVANLKGGKTKTYLENLDAEDGGLTRDKFKAIRCTWDATANQYSVNSEMAGYFTDGHRQGSEITTTTYGEEKPINVRTSMTLHCWLRRLASKVTVTFDATDLDASTTIYIKEIRIHDLPYDCALLEKNTPVVTRDGQNMTDKSGGMLNDSRNTQVIQFSESTSPTQWPRLTSGRVNLDDYQNAHEYGHADDHYSLFLYENMQGEGESKLQDEGTNDGKGGVTNSTPDGKIDSPDSTIPGNDHYKDNKPAGTYVEVKAYYVSEAAGNEGRGDIIYRFMLGKDVLNNYDVERNYHYKLTLTFRGWANDYDWHIEYRQKTNEITIPNPYYISYGYSESLEMPISVMGEVEWVKARILRNDWWPSILWEDKELDDNYHFDRTKVYFVKADVDSITKFRDEYKEKVDANPWYKADPSRRPRITNEGDQVRNEGVAFGFLSLKKAHGNVIGHNKTLVAAGVDSIYTGDWNERMLGVRYYKCDEEGTFGKEQNNGEYRVVIDPAKGDRPAKTTMYLPLYTRQKNLFKTTSYTGSNPYTTGQRRAQVLYTFKLKGKEPKDTLIDIIQVARMENPTGIWRDWNNDKPFKVVLKVRHGQYSNDFRNLRSKGGWSAEVESGNDWILLNGGRRKIYGGDESNITFTYRPAGTLLDETKVRCGVILIRYHNYSCVHRIFVRQGYAPIKVHDSAPVAWYSYNMVSKTQKTPSPLDEGSMFKYTNWSEPIAASNNDDVMSYNQLTPNSFKNQEQKKFEIVGGKPTLWKNIKSKAYQKTGFPWGSETFEFEGNKVALMSIENMVLLREGETTEADADVTVRNAYGVCYGDEATETKTYLNEAFSFQSIAEGGTAETETYGMRGCFAYNRKDGRQVFFPIGRSGYGHRKAGRKNMRYTTASECGNPHGWTSVTDDEKYGWGYFGAGEGVLRYACGRMTYMLDTGDNAPKQPMFYDLYRREGAVYWANATGSYTGYTDRTSLDINYFTFDFNPLGTEPFFGSGVKAEYDNNRDYGSDACFIRLVSYGPADSSSKKK
ncbi:MAG: hypothetical protein NC339_04080 [Muribaculaceae bacterium]|nr:hypothetical protein [Muribaculaceae bacterium]